MAIIRIQHSFQGSSGLPEDQYVNTFYAGGARPEGAALPGLATAVKHFFSEEPGTESFAVEHYMGALTDSPGATIKIYDLADAVPRTPLYVETYTPTAHGGSTANLPNEVACCLSYAASPLPGTPMSRRRGRLYIGPLNYLAAEASASANSIVSGDIQRVLVAAAQDLSGIFGGLGYTWSVYSPTEGSASPIVRCWVDDAWDIQRRRGTKPTARVSGVITP